MRIVDESRDASGDENENQDEISNADLKWQGYWPTITALDRWWMDEAMNDRSDERRLIRIDHVNDERPAHDNRTKIGWWRNGVDDERAMSNERTDEWGASPRASWRVLKRKRVRSTEESKL